MMIHIPSTLAQSLTIPKQDLTLLLGANSQEPTKLTQLQDPLKPNFQHQYRERN